MIPYEAPHGRRVNAIGLYISHGPAAGRLVYETTASLPANRAKKARSTPEERAAAHGLRPEQVGSIDSERLVEFIWKSGGRPAVYPEDWQRERPLVIWLDNYSVHKSERVQAELPALERAGITLCYLPSYSPELNADEMANADLKQGVTKLAPARTKLQLVKATAKHLRSVQRQPERIRKYFEHEPVRYAA